LMVMVLTKHNFAQSIDRGCNFRFYKLGLDDLGQKKIYQLVKSKILKSFNPENPV
jgi:hypothetical protein